MATSSIHALTRTVGWVLPAVIVSGALRASLVSAATPLPVPDRVEFNRDVRPVLSDSCFVCHGPDRSTRKASFRLDREEIAKEDRGGYHAIVPNHPDQSDLVRRIFSSDPDEQMPPPDSGKTLSERNREVLRRWIEQGAVWEEHWAYLPPKTREMPEVRQTGWPLNQVDHFILAKLEALGLEPAKEADRRTLIRRASLDLIGLPPSPEEVAAFVNDRDEHAYERLVDRLLDSEHYGERMAVPWLDAVRYADTVGYHGDQNQNIFPYRDYVINAFNQNKPFDQFTIEQLAGDLLTEPTVEQRVATGFNRLNMMTREGGAQPKEYLAKYAGDRVRTVATTWLGSTLGCAECHDHKFDPFTTKDFYAMAAFFADVKQWGVYGDYAYTPNPELKGFDNDSPFPPELEVESPYLTRRNQRFRQESKDLIRHWASSLSPSNEAAVAFAAWSESARTFLNLRPDGWAVWPVLAAQSSKGATATALSDGSLLIEGKVEAQDHTIELAPLPGRWSAMRLEVLPDAAHHQRIARGDRHQFKLKLSVSVRRAQEEEPVKVAVYYADADRKKTRYRQGLPVPGITDQWETTAAQAEEPHTAYYLFAEPVETKPGDVWLAEINSEAVGKVRLAASPFAAPAADGLFNAKALREALTTGPEQQTEAQQNELHTVYFASAVPDPKGFDKLKALQDSIFACYNGRAPTMVTVPMEEPLEVRVLARGNWMDDSSEVVRPSPPQFLTIASVNSETERMTRLDLAHWITSRDNPLTARHFMNRLWRQLFGTGISSKLDDIGSQGEWPTHPELLDWLAVEFMESGWDVKHMVRVLVTSRAYRQDSNPSPVLVEADPYNRLYGRMSPRRLQAEFVRDNALAVSGLLNRDLGGPSAKPYQPDHYYEHLNFPKRAYEAHTDDRQYRRGVYMHWQRTFLHPMLSNFDAPSREECGGDRPLSNSPQQALTLLNDPTFAEAARVWAERVLRDRDRVTFRDRLGAIYERGLARPPTGRERRSLRQFYRDQRAHYRDHKDDADRRIGVGRSPEPEDLNPVELAAWSEVCRVVLNLHETITRY